MRLTLKNVANWLALPEPHEDKILSGVSIDTRTLVPGDLFVAFKGEKVDGHEFISEAIARGAAAILCTDEQQDLAVPVLLHDDLEAALITMATAYRQTFECPVIALTGSNGKTSVKEMLGAILGTHAFVTPGNFNNHLGVPLSVLRVNASHQYAVFELGANHAGEIAKTVAIVKPDVALVNNIGAAHIEGFGSLDGTARAKGEIYEGLSSEGTAVINADDGYHAFWDDVLPTTHRIYFSIKDAQKTITASDVQLSIEQTCFKMHFSEGVHEVILHTPGVHQVHNALAAASSAYAVGILPQAIAKGLSTFTGVHQRLTPKKTEAGALILDDTYNANLNSVLAGIAFLAAHPGTRLLVLGDMGELGDYAKHHHEAVGVAAKEKGIDGVLTCGKLSAFASEAFGTPAMHFESHAELVNALKPRLDEKTTVLVKGSRSSAMEVVVAGLFK